ncbi:MAG: alpha/beta fold hydrolase, partial [Candidatus Omnitrophica bacterium]|nr:alpha/beta fold hydrolase [Candidatus Omnitrophota bacterium]
VFLQKNQIDRANIIAWSLGAQVALRLTLDRPELVQSLVLVSTTPKFIADDNFPHGLSSAQVRKRALDIKKDLISGINDFQSRLFCRAEIKEKRFRPAFQILKQCKPPSLDAALAGLEVLKTTDLRSELKNIQIPTLIIHGKEDSICPFPAAEYMAQTIPNAHLELMENTGHVPHLTRPEKFNSILNDFLKEGREFQ